MVSYLPMHFWRDESMVKKQHFIAQSEILAYPIASQLCCKVSVQTRGLIGFGRGKHCNQDYRIYDMLLGHMLILYRGHIIGQCSSCDQRCLLLDQACAATSTNLRVYIKSFAWLTMTDMRVAAMYTCTRASTCHAEPCTPSLINDLFYPCDSISSLHDQWEIGRHTCMTRLSWCLVRA